MSDTITILDPRAEAPVETVARPTIAPERGALRDMRIALLHNGNAKFDRIADRLAEKLETLPATVHRYRKARYGAPAPGEVLSEIEADTALAVVGLAC